MLPSLGERALTLATGKPNINYTRHILALTRTMSASQYSAVSARSDPRYLGPDRPPRHLRARAISFGDTQIIVPTQLP
jgi:hypothetical protein